MDRAVLVDAREFDNVAARRCGWEGKVDGGAERTRAVDVDGDVCSSLR